MPSFQTLKTAIERDLLTERPKAAPTPECFCCGREYTPGLGGGDDSTRFCSDRCRDAYDRGLPRQVDIRTATGWLEVEPASLRSPVPPPFPACTRCGGACVELYKGRGGPFCHWRCRDDKPRDCEVCGLSLYNSGRKGPYCSIVCANKTRKRPQIAKPQNSVQETPVE